MRARVLVLAGTAEAKRLCHRLSRTDGFDVVASLAGLPGSNPGYPVRIRTGGFGGAAGLARFVRERRISLIMDATHPFACRITANASAASQAAAVPYVRLERAAWNRRESEKWIEADCLERLFSLLPGHATAFAPLGSGMFHPRHAKLFASRQDVRFIVRSLSVPDGPVPANIADVILDRPPFALATETETLRRVGADCLVCRNSGGEHGRSKLLAARNLGLPVFMLARPSEQPLPPGGVFCRSVEEAVSAIGSRLAGRGSV